MAGSVVPGLVVEVLVMVKVPFMVGASSSMGLPTLITDCRSPAHGGDVGHATISHV